MAFETNNGSTASRNSNGNAQAQSNDNWKAESFLNIYLPSAGGGRVKLGAIPLKKDKPREKQLSDWLREDSEDKVRLNKLLLSLIIEFNPAEQTDANNFALFGEDPAA